MELITKLFELVFSLLEGVLTFVFEFIEQAISGIPKKKKGYHAKFGSVGSLLSRRNTGFCLTGNKNLSLKASYENCMVVGSTGTGKSSIVLLPSLYSMQSSLIINDPSGEGYAKGAKHLFDRKYEVKVLHFSNPAISCSYNPLARANTSSDINKVASLLIANAMGGNSKDPFWNTGATALLAMIIAILKKQDVQFHNLFNARQLLNQLGSSPEKVDALFSRYADEVLYNEYKSFLSFDEKVVSGIIATCKAALQFVNDESVARITSHDDLNFSDFRNKRVALFIQNSVADQKYFSVLTSIFFEQYFAYVMSRFPDKAEQDIFFLIDEASSLRLPTLQIALSNVRKHRAGIMLLVQSENQLTNFYGRPEAEAIKANCFSKLFFTGQSLESAKELELILGKFEYKKGKQGTAIRSLMTNDEIRTLKPTRAILICGHHLPLLVKLKPYYKQSKYKNITLVSPPVIHTHITDTIPILPLPTPDA